MKARLLVVDDDRSIREALAERFGALDYAVSTAGSGKEALAGIRHGTDVVLLDLQLPHGDGLEVLATMQAEGLEATVIVITAHGSVEKAVAAMKSGAYDFLEKPFAAERIEETVRRAAERATLVRANRALRSGDDEPVAASAPMRAVLDKAAKAAASDATVLVTGESGTGKEVVARCIHRWSPRADGPFVAVNCAALSESLLESELFGHEKGAFTGASARHEGRLEAAHGGTLFLDEIGDTTPAFQVKLLRVLQERTFERVGGNRSIEVDLRVVAATNRDLKKSVEDGGFREDLYFRLAVIPLSLPPLRERPEDVVALAEHFLAELAAHVKRPGLVLGDETRATLLRHDWPGNVRELRNAIERACVLCDEREIQPEDLALELSGRVNDDPGDGFHARVETYRKQVLREALERSGGNQTEAAKALGLQRTYLARLVKKYGLTS